MFGLGKLLYVVILVVNGIAILSEDRFLNRIGWGSLLSSGGGSGSLYPTLDASSDALMKTKLINLIGAIRTLLRVPLIAVNVLLILYELILG